MLTAQVLIARQQEQAAQAAVMQHLEQQQRGVAASVGTGSSQEQAGSLQGRGQGSGGALLAAGAAATSASGRPAQSSGRLACLSLALPLCYALPQAQQLQGGRAMAGHQQGKQ